MLHPSSFRTAFSIGLVALVTLGFSFASIESTVAQSPSDSDKTEIPSARKSTSGFQFADLIGKNVDVLTKKGYYRDAKVESIEPGKLDNSVKYFKLVAGQKTAKVLARRIVEMHQNGKNLDVSYDGKNKCLIHDLEKRAERLAYERETNARLRPERQRLWPHLTVDQEDKFLSDQAKFIEDAKAKFPNIPFRQVETKYFSFVTDLNRAEVDGYIVYLDAMYAELCKAFGLSTEKNIWAGKCVVFAFRDEQTYLAFESIVMEISPTAIASTQGLCHQFADGTVIFAGYKGTNNFFGHVLVHETSHGFVHRYMSSVRAPSWLNEGMADWLADKVVKGTKIKNRQRKSAANVKQKGDWGDVLNIGRITGEQYGICSVLVEILVAKDGGKGRFKEFFDGIKEGQSPQESLKEHFGMTYAELKDIYGQTISRR